MKENQTNKSLQPLDKKVESENKTQKLNDIKKRQKLMETQKFKSRYFDYYDDIKISDRQDW